ncbi:4570_t:CDS:2 [Ambispora gerdemannii]|uniref:4570_t:CDS:1 n=1 Tax=Ambispora gerdemannii TaxID=144530 RepID=A0A9N9AEG8_9GLOM|nr:4570_t:CDS:2 [Ambispora gerdemannii]
MVKVPKALKPTLDFRRSVTKDKISTPIAIPTKHPPSILPPKKVIKALYDYDASAPRELSFSKGDFFHVVGDENDANWYEACNPATNLRGLVPVSYFQVLEKSNRLSGSEKIDPNAFYDPSIGGQKPQPLYGIVLYDFAAERPDELNAKAGEPIIVIAQSNHEWFVAKPIGRLGGPGLIPVSFVEIRDHSTGKAIENIQELMDNSIVPRVEDWKKMTQDYQEASISLGRLEFAGDSKFMPTGIESDPKLAPVGMMDQGNNMEYDPKLAPMGVGGGFEYATEQSYEYGGGYVAGRHSNGSDTLPMIPNSSTLQNKLSPSSPPLLPSNVLNNFNKINHNHYQNNERSSGGILDEINTASVDSFHFQDDRYWFLVRVELSSGRFRMLYRLYEDFYEFQIALLNEFPAEAGRTGQQRILPFMPGPLSYVNDMITAQRRADLDVYVKELLNLPDYILQHPQLQQLFGIREGDSETAYDPRNNNDSRVNGNNSIRKQTSMTNGAGNGGGLFKHSHNGSSSSSSIAGTGSGHNKHQTLSHQDSNPQMRSNNNTQIKGTNGKANFIKIKIFYQEDLIAIRVPAEVSFAALREKLYDRLKGHVTSLHYKDERTGESFELEGDADLQAAIAKTPKLVIYAE